MFQCFVLSTYQVQTNALRWPRYQTLTTSRSSIYAPGSSSSGFPPPPTSQTCRVACSTIYIPSISRNLSGFLPCCPRPPYGRAASSASRAVSRNYFLIIRPVLCPVSLVRLWFRVRPLVRRVRRLRSGGVAGSSCSTRRAAGGLGPWQLILLRPLRYLRVKI